jgi:ABC-type Fe3+ transport system substrate-binding protein
LTWVLVLEYNTNLLQPNAVPKSFDDLADDRYKGKIVIADPARSTSGLGLIKAMVTAKGWDWVERFVRNDPLVMSISSGIQPAVITGERPIAVMTSDLFSKTAQDKAPIALATNEFLFASPGVAAILKDGPNPEGAEIFVEFLLSREAQDIVRAFGAYSCRSDVAPPFGLPPLKEAKLRFPLAPAIDLQPREVGDRFHQLLRTAK